MDHLLLIKLIAAVVILCMANLAGSYPFFRKWQAKSLNLPIAEALASGIFLGAGLIHMLNDATADFIQLHYDYPIASLIAGATFLLFLAIEHWGREVAEHKGAGSTSFAIIAFLMLSIHSVFAGAALGLSAHVTIALLLFIAIIAHKWMASFALSLQLNKSNMTLKNGLILFLIFSLMTPLGILFGSYILHHLAVYPTLQPCFNAIAAGTFIYLGTLHGLSRSFMVKKCCDLENFIFVIVGFTIMAVVAIWM